MKLTVHQPNFFPWLPWFEKMDSADVMVILNHAQWSKGGYQNRFKMGDTWLTMPVRQGLEPIADKRYIEPAHAWRGIKRSLPEYAHILGLFDDCISTGLSETNAAIIGRIARLLEISTSMASDSETGLVGTARLLDICLRWGADTYVSGPSGRNYLDMDLFRAAGVAVEFYDAPPESKVPILEVL